MSIELYAIAGVLLGQVLLMAVLLVRLGINLGQREHLSRLSAITKITAKVFLLCTLLGTSGFTTYMMIKHTDILQVIGQTSTQTPVVTPIKPD